MVKCTPEDKKTKIKNVTKQKKKTKIPNKFKIYRCRCGKYVDPESDSIGYSNRLCTNCYTKVIAISIQNHKDIKDIIEESIPFVEVNVSRF